jgi:hypothetical protein
MVSVIPLAAQSSSLQGAVTDAQGAVVTGAIVTITNTDTSAVRKEATDETGVYRILQVVPGPYKIEVQKPGFQTKITSLALQVDAPATLNVQLDVGQTSNVVNVNAETTQINTENASVGNPFTETQIQQLPLQTRNVVSLLAIQPGVSSGGQVLGSRPDQNNVILDGADVNDNRGANGFNSVLPIPLDSIQEFRTTIAGQGADEGHSAGGQVAIVTKSGSNSFHGSLYEYNRNTDYEANDFFSNKSGIARPALIRNQYGASLGGPIKKNKLFFFYNYEGRKDRSQGTKSDTVPSATFREGIVEVLLKGQTTPLQLTPAQVQAIDPLGIGEDPSVLALMQQYPQGNNPSQSSDKGLNFNVLTFNAPSPLNYHVQVGKIDYTINSKNTFSVRGTLTGDSQVAASEQFPGQQPSSESQNNSRGVSARETYVITSTLVNAFNFGYTRVGTATTGNLNVIPTVGFTALQATPSGSSRIAPTPNITDDLTWNHGRHTIQAGFNFHQAQNITTNYRNEPGFSFSSSNLLNLGNDITGDVLAYIQKTTPGAALNSNSNVISAFGTMLGIENAASATYNYGINGQAIPFGTPVTRNFISNSPEFYVQDSWKAKSNLTITGGLRYSIYGVPYEANGVEVVPTTPLNEYFAQRQAAGLYGIPNWELPTAFVTYGVGGKVNNGPAYYPTDYKNFAPRLGLAYQPKGDLERILGKGSVLRAGAGIVYDNYGNAMASAFSSGASPGLATQVQNPVNTNFTNSNRYPVLSPLSPPSGGSFPYTPPLIVGGFNQFTGVASDLKAPYEYVLNANYARPLPKHMSIEIGYAGRLAHRAIVDQDFAQPLTNFVDPKSGQSWQQATTILANMYYSGLTTAQVKANPNLVPTLPFAQDLLPGLAGHYIPGSASANLFYDAYAEYAGSWGDTMNDVDRIRQTNGGCIVITGCNTFYPMQGSGLESYVNAGEGSYHALTVSLRRTVSHGIGYDFNYTLSHAIDNGSSSETSDGQTSALQNAFCPRCGMGPSDFDARHQITADAVIELPVGKGKSLAGNIPTWLDQVIGGWQVTTLFTFRTGTPLTCTASGVYNSNYNEVSNCILNPSLSSPPVNKLQIDQLGFQNAFPNTGYGADFVPEYPNTSGYRGIMRGWNNWNDDAAVGKFFKLPKEGMRLQLRGEAYNLFNHEIFSNPSLSISQLPGTTTTGAVAQYGSSTFGEIKSSASSPRVLQVAMRLTF